MTARAQKHFVVFYSPGAFVAETTERPIKSWAVETAIRMARTITERHGATPYGFVFVTRSRGPRDLDSKETKRSGMHYLGGKVETLAEVEARDRNSILASNMRSNGWDRVITTTKGWKWTQPLRPGDVVLKAQP